MESEGARWNPRSTEGGVAEILPDEQRGREECFGRADEQEGECDECEGALHALHASKVASRAGARWGCIRERS